MIRFLLLTIVPLFLPFAVWYVWKVFVERPKLDAATGEQSPPELNIASIKALAIIGVLLSLITVCGFLLSHDEAFEKPYAPINMKEAEEELNRGITPDRPVRPN